MDPNAIRYDHLFKILLVGDTGAGKTSFILRFSENKFSSRFISTIGIDFRVKTIERRGFKIKLQVGQAGGNWEGVNGTAGAKVLMVR